MKYFSIWFFLVIIMACTSELNEDYDQNCNIISLDFHLDNKRIISKLPLPNDKQDSARLEIILDVSNLHNEVVQRSGGYVDGGFLLNGCSNAKEIKPFYDEFRKTEFNKNYELLELENEKSKAFIHLMNTYFYQNNNYFNDNYFERHKLFQFTTELLIFQVALLSTELESSK